jgi:hypothetical protein
VFVDEEGKGDRRIPTPALVLGTAGLLPLILAMLVRLGAGIEPATSLPATIGSFALIYGALILSFLGGMWWGVAATRLDAHRQGPLLAIAVVPTLIAWPLIALMFAKPVLASVLLGAALIATLLVDRGLASRGLVPRWWMRLRVPLSFGLGVLVIGLGLSLG